MKLKKIASVALAGVMAVSVLAGCGADANANSGNTNTDPTTSTSVVDAVNDGQAASNVVKVTFTSDAKLDDALKTAVDKYGMSAEASTSAAVMGNVATAVTNMTGLKVKNCPAVDNQNWKWTTFGNISSLLTGGVGYAWDKDDLDDGDTYTVYAVLKYDGSQYPTEEAVVNTFAKTMDEYIAKLAVSSDDSNNDGKLNSDAATGVFTGDNYFGYTYDGVASMTSYTQPDGTVDYFVAFALNQHVAKKTL